MKEKKETDKETEETKRERKESKNVMRQQEEKQGYLRKVKVTAELNDRSLIGQFKPQRIKIHWV